MICLYLILRRIYCAVPPFKYISKSDNIIKCKKLYLNDELKRTNLLNNIGLWTSYLPSSQIFFSSVSLTTLRPDYYQTCRIDISLKYAHLFPWRRQITGIYPSGKRTKLILKLQVSNQQLNLTATIGKHRTLKNFPSCGRNTATTPRVHQQLIQEITKEPSATSKALLSVKVTVYDSTMKKRKDWTSSTTLFQSQKHGWPKRTQKL